MIPSGMPLSESEISGPGVPPGVRFTPVDLDTESGSGGSRTGVLCLAGSSGRIDADRARLLAGLGALTESIQWFGAPGQQPAPFEVPVELFQGRIEALARECDRIVVVGTSFGAEAALVVASHTPLVDAVVAFAPTDVVWAGVRPDGSQTSHWTRSGIPLPFVHFDEEWEPDSEPPAFVELYRRSRAANLTRTVAAHIDVTRTRHIVVIAGGDDQVWPSVMSARRIEQRRAAAGLATVVVTHPLAGHRTMLPGEPVATGGMRMARGGTPEADRALGERAWEAIVSMVAPSRSQARSPARSSE